MHRNLWCLWCRVHCNEPSPCPPFPDSSRRVVVEDILPQKVVQTILCHWCDNRWSDPICYQLSRNLRAGGVIYALQMNRVSVHWPLALLYRCSAAPITAVFYSLNAAAQAQHTAGAEAAAGGSQLQDVVRLGCGTSVRLQLGVASTTEKKLPVMGVTCSRANPARRNKVANSCSVRSLPP